MLTAHEEKMVFMAARLQADPTLKFEDAEALYHRSLGFTESDIARLQKRRERQIDRIKTQIDAGTYQPPPGRVIAEGLVEDAIWQARNECIRQQERAQHFSQEAGMRQDAGVVSAPSSELFVPVVFDLQSSAPRSFSLLEWAVIGLMGGIALVLLANALGLVTTGGTP